MTRRDLLRSQELADQDLAAARAEIDRLLQAAREQMDRIRRNEEPAPKLMYHRKGGHIWLESVSAEDV